MRYKYPSPTHYALATAIVKQYAVTPKPYSVIIDNWAKLLANPHKHLVVKLRSQSVFDSIWNTIYTSYLRDPSILSNKEYKKILSNLHYRTKEVYTDARYL